MATNINYKLISEEINQILGGLYGLYISSIPFGAYFAFLLYLFQSQSSHHFEIVINCILNFVEYVFSAIALK